MKFTYIFVTNYICYVFSKKQRISGLCFIKNSDYKEPETYLR